MQRGLLRQRNMIMAQEKIAYYPARPEVSGRTIFPVQFPVHANHSRTHAGILLWHSPLKQRKQTTYNLYHIFCSIAHTIVTTLIPTKQADSAFRKSKTLNQRRLKLHKQISYLVSVIRRISLARRPMKFTDSSTGGNFGIGIVVDW